MDLGTIHYGIEVNTTDVNRANKDIDAMGEQAKQTGVAVDAMGKKIVDSGKKIVPAVDGASESIGGFSKKAGQAGVQIQQFVGQIQGGQSAFVALSQQASDLGIVLGAPLLGAFVGIASVAGGVLFQSIIATGKAMEEMADRARDLAKDMDDLSESQKLIVNNAMRFVIKDEQDAIDELRKTIAEGNKKVNELRESHGKLVAVYGASGRVYHEVANNTQMIFDAEKEVSANELLLVDSQKKLNELKGEGSKKDKQRLTDSQQIIKSLESEQAQLTLTGAAMANYLALKSKATEEERALIQMLYIGNEARKEIEEQNKKDAKAREDANKKAIADEERRADSIKKLNEQMKREAELFGVTSKEAQVLYDIKNGLIKVTGGLAGAEAQALIASAKRIDQQQKEKEELEAYAENYRNWAKEQKKIDEEANKERLKFSEDAAERINGAFASAWVGVIDDADSAFDGIANSFKQLLAEMAHEALTKPIIMNIQQKMSGGGATSAQGASSAIGAGGWWGVLAVAVAAGANEYNKQQEKLFAEMTAEFRQGNQSIGTILGEANAKSDSIAGALEGLGDLSSDMLNVNRGMYQALIDIRSGIAGVASGFARQFGIAGIGSSATAAKSDTFGFNTGAIKIGDKAADIFFGGLGDSLFGGDVNEFVKGFMGGITTKISKALYSNKTKVIDSGIQFIGQGLAEILTGATLEAFAYADIQTKKKTFGITTSNKVKTQQEELDAILLGQFTDVFAGAGDALSQAAGAFGLDFQNYIDKLIIDPQKLSLKDLEGEELTKEIESFFSSTLDNWAGVLVGGTGTLEKFQQVGEGAFETVIRLASELNAFNSYADLLDLNFTAVGFAAVEATQNIAKFAGGFDQLNSSLGGYYQNFFTEEERAQKQMAMLGDALQEIGINAIPESREAFRSLIEGIDLTTEAGQKQFAVLINLQGVFAELVPVTEEFTESLIDFKEIANGAFASLSASIEAERARIEGIVSAASSAKNAVDIAVENEKNKLEAAHKNRIDLLESMAKEEREQAEATAKAEFEAAKAIAKARENAIKSEIDALSDSLKGLESLFGSLTDAIYDMGVESDAITARRRRAAEFEIETALRNAREGRGLPASGQLDRSLSILREDPTSLYSSAAEMARDVAITQNRLAALADITGTRISNEQRSLAALESQLEAARSAAESLEYIAPVFESKYDKMIEQETLAYEAQLKALDQVSADAQSQFDKLTGIDTRVLGLDESIKLFNDSLLAADFENAEMQLDKLDQLEAEAKRQTEIMNGTYIGVLSLNDAFVKFTEAMAAAAASNNAVQLETLQGLAAELRALRADTNAGLESVSRHTASTASSTKSLYKDGVQLIPEPA